ncbi:MAG: glutathione peroxidase [Chitinophagales bacterium]|nr:glutathione peroxidase [Chitinophagales bacterium]MDW8418335.1 glutathione peroxidase [Chitinophagales bacterium]
MNGSNKTIYDFRLKDASGKEVDMSTYRGKVLLIVNTATGCGLWPQMKDLEMMREKYHERGFEVLLFPSNSFYQEPKSSSEVQQVCEINYRSPFVVFEKAPVRGSGAQPLYRWLKQQSGVYPFWNFHKYFIDRKGNVAGWFNPLRRVTHDKITAFTEKLLNQPTD